MSRNNSTQKDNERRERIQRTAEATFVPIERIVGIANNMKCKNCGFERMYKLWVSTHRPYCKDGLRQKIWICARCGHISGEEVDEE